MSHIVNPLPSGLRAVRPLAALFVGVRLAQLTFGATLSSFDASTPYRNVIATQSSWPVALGYVVAAIAEGAHLLPGVWSGVRTLGGNTQRTEVLARALSPALALVVAIGLSLVPLAVTLRLVS
jgi:hypothetical protein